MLLVDDDQAEVAGAARTPPSACRRRRRPRRGGCGAIGRAARRRTARCAGSRRGRRSARGTARRPPASARSPAPAAATPRPRRRHLRREPQVDLGLAAAGDAVQQRRVKSVPLRRAPRAVERGRLLVGERPARRPARGRRRRVAGTDRVRPAASGSAPGPSAPGATASRGRCRGAAAPRESTRPARAASSVERLALLALSRVTASRRRRPASAPLSSAPAPSGVATRTVLKVRRPRPPDSATRRGGIAAPAPRRRRRRSSRPPTSPGRRRLRAGTAPRRGCR